MLTMGLFLEVLFPKMDTGLQLGSHWQLVARHNCLSYFSYYSPINTARNTFLARASQSWLTFSIGSCISPDLPDLTYQVQDSWHWFLPLACPQQGRELCWAEAPACTTAPCASTTAGSHHLGSTDPGCTHCQPAPRGGHCSSCIPWMWGARWLLPCQASYVPLTHVDAWKTCNSHVPSCSTSDSVIFWKFKRQKGFRWKLLFPELSRWATEGKVSNQKMRHISAIWSETSKTGLIQR